MKSLLKVILVLALIFASTFLVIRFSGVLSEDDIKVWLETAASTDPVYVLLAIVLLLAVDIFIAIPTLTVCILAGYFLDFPLGGLSASVGLILAGTIGYWISRMVGERTFRYIVRSANKRDEAIVTFGKYNIAMILMSRGSPILPEVCACLAGITKMKFSKFILVWCANSVPYAFIAAYSGSISSLQNPKPAIYTIIGLYVVLWSAWFFFRKKISRQI